MKQPTKTAALAIFCAVALLSTGRGFLPGRVLLPLDLVSDFGLWKPDPTERRAVSNSQLPDALLEFLPWDAASRRHLARGEFPWVDPLIGSGAPLFANPQAALLSPFTWPRLLFGPAGWAPSVFFKLVVAGISAAWLAAELGAEGWAAVLSGVVFELCGALVIWGLHPHSNVIVWLPAAAAAFRRLRRSPTRGRVAAVVALSALAAAGGHPECFAAGSIGLAAFLVWEDRVGGSGRERRGSWARPLAASLLGVALLAVVFVPFGIIASHSLTLARRHATPAAGFRMSGPLWEILPGASGSPLGGEIDFFRAVPWGEGFFYRAAGFVGAITLLCLVLAWRTLPASFRRAAAVGGAALVLSWRPPLVTPLFHRLPILSMINPIYWVVVFAILASVAAGPAILAAASGPRRRGVALATGLCGAILLGVGLAPSIGPMRNRLAPAVLSRIENLRERRMLSNSSALYESRMPLYLDLLARTARRRAALPGLCWIVAAAGLVLRRRRGFLLAAAAAGELAGFGNGYLPSVRTADLPARPPALSEIDVLDPGRRFFLAAGLGVYPPNLATLDGLRDVRDFSVVESQESLTPLDAAGYNVDTLAFPDRPSADQVRALARLGVRFFLSREEPPGASRIGGDAPPAVGLYELPGAMAIPTPANRPPAGIVIGLAATIAALCSTAALSRLAPPRAGPAI